MIFRLTQHLRRIVEPRILQLAVKPFPEQAVRLITRTGIIVLSLFAAIYVSWFGSNVPNSDEWDFVPQIVGPWPSTTWYFTHHNEHRYPVARALWVATVRLSGDFRTPMYLIVVLFGLSSYLLVQASELWRGRPSLGDLIIPSLLLNWGHGLNFTMGYQLAFSLYIFSLSGIVWAAARQRVSVLGLFSMLTVVCGGFGLAASGPLFLLCLVLGIRRCRFLLFVAVAIAAYTAWQLLTLPSTVERIPGKECVIGFIANLATGWGMAVTHRTMMFWWLAAGVSLCGYAAALWRLRQDFKTADRQFVMVLAVVLVVILISSLAVGYSRGYGAIGDRFVSSSAIGLAVFALILGRQSAWWQGPLTLVIFVANISPGYRYGEMGKSLVADFEADRGRQMAPMFLAGVHGGGLPFLNPRSMETGIEQLKAASWPSYRFLPANPEVLPIRAEANLPQKVSCSQYDLKKGLESTHAITFADPHRAVLGLRIRGEQLFPLTGQKMQMTWIDAEGIHHRQTVIPRVVPGAFEINIPINGQPRDVQLIPTSVIAGIRFDTAEWLTPIEQK